MVIKFNKDRKDFFIAVKSAVEDYFIKTNRGKKANGFMVFKTAFFLIIVMVSYHGLLMGNFHVLQTYILWITLSLSSVFLAVNCGHDAIHGSYSDKKWVNTIMSKSFDLLGANSYLWSITHNIVHHTYTSIEGADEDIESVPFARLTPHQEWRPIQKYQHIYVFILYCFGTLSWVIRKDYKKFFQPKIGLYDNTTHHSLQYFNLFFYKILYFSTFLFLPLIVMDLAWYYVVTGFIIGHLVEGLTIAIIFSLAHIVEEAEFLVPDERGNLENSWAIHQMYTTVDFGRTCRITSFLTGGLNFQIEHHLFPTICHVHYPAISEIVKQKAEEYGVPYKENPSFFHAFRSHYRHLKRLGMNSSAHLTQA